MKTISFKNGLWQIILVLLPIPFTVWITISASNHPDNINYLYYFINKNVDFLSIPQPIKDKVDITYNGESIKNLSVLKVYLLNTTSKNLSNVQVHFEIQNKEKTFTLISNSFTGPDNYPKEGIHTIPSADPDIYIFNIDAMNITDHASSADFFIAEFVFLGKELPEIKVSTSNIGLQVRDINKKYEETNNDLLITIGRFVNSNVQLLAIIGFILIMVFAVIMVLYADKVARYYIRNSLRQYLQELGDGELSTVHIDNILKVVDELHRRYVMGWESIIIPLKALINHERLD